MTSRSAAHFTQEAAQVVEHRRGGPDWFHLLLHAPRIAAAARPGQFVQVRVTPLRAPAFAGAPAPPAAPLLRRPLSFCTLDPESQLLSLIYRVVGAGTAELADARPGERLELLGPLGRPFPDPRSGSDSVVLVGGGLGIPPLACAAGGLLAAGRPAEAILGARTADLLAGVADVEAAGVPVRIVTEDGSRGAAGLVTDVLRAVLGPGGRREVWACGPAAMLEAVRRECAIAHARCWVLVETPMACGFGVCLGCAVPRADGRGYLRACVDGPVFASGEVGALA